MADTQQAEVNRLLNQFHSLRDQVHGTYVAAVKKDAPYYNLTFAQKLVPAEWRKKGIQAVVPTTARNAVDNAADHIMTTPRLRVPTRPTEVNKREEAELADRKRMFLRFVFEELETQCEDPLAQGVKSLIKDGKVVIKTLINWDRVPDEVGEEPLGMDGLPWNWRSLPPESVFEDPDDFADPRYVYETYQVRVGTAARHFPKASGNWKNQPDTEKVNLIEYWSKPEKSERGKHLVWIEEDKVSDEANPYFWENPDGSFDGYVPYLIAPSGWGERTVDGEMDKLYVGILRFMHSILDAEASHQTDGSAQLKMSTFPPILGRGISEGQKLNVGLGRVTRLPDPTQTLEFMKWPELPVSLFQLISRVTDQANELSKFGTLGGNVQRGVDTATESDANLRNAAAKLVRPVNNLRGLLRRGAKRLLQDVERIIEQPVSVFGSAARSGGVIMITPDEIEGFYAVNVELTTTDQATLDRIQSRMWADLYQIFEDLSAETAMENAGIDDFASEQIRSAKERAFRAPPNEQLRIFASLAAQGEVATPIRNAFQRQIEGGSDPNSQQEAGAEGGANPTNSKRETSSERPGEPIIRQSQQDAQTTQAGRESQ
jgi:hypothetical protein